MSKIPHKMILIRTNTIFFFKAKEPEAGCGGGEEATMIVIS